MGVGIVGWWCVGFVGVYDDDDDVAIFFSEHPRLMSGLQGRVMIDGVG